MKKSIIILTAIMSIVLGVASGFGYYYYKNVLATDTIYEQIKIDGYDVSNNTKEQALDYIKEKKKEEIDKSSMNLIYGEKVYKVNLEDLGFNYNYSEAINTAFQYGRQGNVFERMKEIKKIKSNTKNVDLESKYDNDKIKDIVENIAREINTEPVDATFNFNGGNIKVTNDILGKRLINDELAKKIIDNINHQDDIDIPIEEINPKLSKEVLSRINGVIGEYSTSFKGSSSDRIENIRLSSKSLNGKLLLPGEELSYNDTTGPRESKYGYKEANVIIGGELTPGVGGGVCQTSTTMYNALLLSDMTILERHPHSLPPSYVNYGQDAAVAYGYLDLKFRNDFDFPIYINSKVINDRVYIYIYGDKNSKNYTVSIKPELVETIKPTTEEIYDGNLAPGTKIDVQKGRTGYKVNTYKTIIKDGKVINKNQITSDYYKQKKYIYKSGPKIETKKEPIKQQTEEHIEINEEDNGDDN